MEEVGRVRQIIYFVPSFTVIVASLFIIMSSIFLPAGKVVLYLRCAQYHAFMRIHDILASFKLTMLCLEYNLL